MRHITIITFKYAKHERHLCNSAVGQNTEG